jgi:phosphinothricin acetyltransferase
MEGGPMNLAIRDATPNDLPSILALFNHHVRETTAIWRDREVDLADRTAWFEDRQRQGFPVLVADAAGEFLGFASYGPFRTGSGYDGTVENSVYVAPDAQGRGVASALMEALIAHARAAGRRVMVAGIGLPNDASVRLHLKCGFTDAGALRGIGLKFGRRLDLLFMQKGL